MTHHLPWPPRSGGTQREYQILKRLVSTNTIDLVSVSRSAGVAAPTAELDALHSYRSFEDIGRQNGLRRRWSRAACDHLAELASGTRPYDVVHCEGGYMLHLLPPDLRKRACLIEHNIEWKLLSHGPRTPRRPFADKAMRRYRAVEEATWRTAACVGTLTQEDEDEVLNSCPDQRVFRTPNGGDHLPVPSHREPQARTIMTVANWRYSPNEEGMRWFLERVWPRVLAQLPDAHLSLIGDSGPQFHEYVSAQRNVKILGFVDDLLPLYASTTLAIAPLLHGGGIKVKVLEALRQGIPVVTTPVGAQGLSGREANLLGIATGPDAFAAGMIRILAAEPDPDEVRERLWVANNLTSWDEAAAAVDAMWEFCGREQASFV